MSDTERTLGLTSSATEQKTKSGSRSEIMTVTFGESTTGCINQHLPWLIEGENFSNAINIASVAADCDVSFYVTRAVIQPVDAKLCSIPCFPTGKFEGCLTQRTMRR